MELNQNVKVHLKGESPWAIITEIIDETHIKARINNDLINTNEHGIIYNDILSFELHEVVQGHPSWEHGPSINLKKGDIKKELCMIVEIENAVNSIEQDIFEQTNGVEYFNISVRSNGFVQIVSFIGIELWNSDDDMRKYINDDEECEPIEVFLRRTIMEELEKLQLIKL